MWLLDQDIYEKMGANHDFPTLSFAQLNQRVYGADNYTFASSNNITVTWEGIGVAITKCPLHHFMNQWEGERESHNAHQKYWQE